MGFRFLAGKKLWKASFGVALCAASVMAADVFITVDQFGYRPDDAKVAVLRDPQKGFDASRDYTPGTSINVMDSASGKVVYSGVAVAHNEGAIDTASGDKVWWFDFSKVNSPGSYYIQDGSDPSKKSFHFRIKEDVYNDVLKAALRMFYYQRVGIAKEAKYAGAEWADEVNHPQDAQARYFMDSTNVELERDVSGGWFDAGDYNKYTDWNGNYIEELLMAFFERPKAFTDDYNIPESGNGVPDILDEVKWGLDHLLRLINEDGSVISVIGEDHATPPSASKGRTYYGAPNATASYSAAKAFAFGARASKIFWGEEYTQKLTDAAVAAFSWAESHSDSLFYNNDANHGTKGLAAGQQEIDPSNDDVNCTRLNNRLNAALRLYELTGESKYKTIFEENYESFPLMHGWGDSYRLDQHLMFLTYRSLADADPAIVKKIDEKMVNLMNKPADFMGAADVDGYRAFSRDYNWGSNGHKSGYGLLLNILADSKMDGIDGDSYRQVAEGYAHYIHGVNPFGYVYLTNMGTYGAENSLTQIYHKWFSPGSKWDYVGEGKVGPAPGYLAGGPNDRYKWDACCDKESCGSASNNALCFEVELPKAEPHSKMYSDINNGWPINSWEITEPSLGYQVRYIHMLSKFVEEKGHDLSEYPLSETGLNPVPVNQIPVNLTFSGNQLLIGGTDLREVRIFNLKNQEVLRQNLSRHQVSLETSSLKAGLYMVQVKTGIGLARKLLLKKR